MTDPLILTGNDLTLDELVNASRPAGQIALAPDALDQMERGHAAIRKAIEDGTPVYGVNTGLGTRVSQTLTAEELKTFSLKTLRGRAQSIGDPIPDHIARAAMIVRANSFLKGVSGASPLVARALAAFINKGLTPVIGDLGSIGSSDLLHGATMGLAMAGEGRIRLADGTVQDASAALAEAGLEPLDLGPRDGLALAGSGAFSAAQAALAVTAAETVFASTQTAAALSIEVFRGNLTPFREAVVAMRPQPGDLAVQREMMTLLRGSKLHQPGTARRLQDPLSIRHLVQIHGAMHQALDSARGTLETEINCATDNPAVDLETGSVISTGNYHTPHITLAVDHVRRGLSMMATAQAARIAKLMANRFTDLPMHLSGDTATSNGFAPVMKTMESVLTRIQTDAMPVAVWPSLSADGIEDALTHSWEAARQLSRCADHCCHLTAIELMAGAQGIDLRGNLEDLGPPMATVYSDIRSIAAGLVEDRPLGTEIEALSAQVANGRFNFRV